MWCLPLQWGIIRAPVNRNTLKLRIKGKGCVAVLAPQNSISVANFKKLVFSLRIQRWRFVRSHTAVSVVIN